MEPDAVHVLNRSKRRGVVARVPDENFTAATVKQPRVLVGSGCGEVFVWDVCDHTRTFEAP